VQQPITDEKSDETEAQGLEEVPSEEGQRDEIREEGEELIM